MPSRAAFVLTALLFAACASAPRATPPAPEAPAPQKLAAPAVAWPALTYPEAPTDDTVDDYHGTRVADPFRPLEDPDAPATRAWIDANNRITFGLLEQIPAREAIRARLEAIWNYDRYGVPVHEGGRLFYEHRSGLQNQPLLRVREGDAGEDKVLIDPNTLSDDGTVALRTWAPSRDGARLAWGFSKAGSDWVEIKIRDVATGKDLKDHLRWAKFTGISWTKDGRGFFYSRYDAPKEGEALQAVNRFHKLYYHRVGTPQADDKLVYERPDQPEWGFAGMVDDAGGRLFIHVWKGTANENGLMMAPLKEGNAPGPAAVRPLLTDFDASWRYVATRGKHLWLQTDKDAPRGRLVRLDLHRPIPKLAIEVIPEGDDALVDVDLVGQRFIAQYLHDAHSKVAVFERDGRPAGSIALPGLGSARGFRGRANDSATWFAFTGFLEPGGVWRYDLRDGSQQLFARPEVPFDTSAYETRQIFYTSADGTRVPMFLVHRKGLEPTGDHPVYLYGYGGFNVSLTPRFSPSVLAWIERGGIYAQPTLRGGGEYGEAWHKAGMLKNKQTVFDDFIAAAEWLIDNRWTRPARLAIGGHSNGGLLVGAVMTQRPELFGAALPGVGVLDMLRFHRFTIGWAWVSEYGSADDPEMFQTLLAYSPLHNLKPGTAYPATMITTADHDDRVVPAHSFKFAAALQQAHRGPAPVLIRVETKAGHGAGKPTSKRIEEAADRWAFLVRALGMESVGAAASTVR